MAVRVLFCDLDLGPNPDDAGQATLAMFEPDIQR
jgi:hypothetical protein